ncbi:growth arrest and DNA damage-inducible protein GADD45 gamma-like isoform X2 [Alosa sapidissima]|uniref:growth arrest and DNA damage-inducible protein GADD45 gamma-like isoform X2 n=1 Tax=Alosa sapidissima TaxID=34773 RepID=UPI001C097E0D|nr:growth arrest and DNA damage-inducible protein GADD45 gamma-like isoform X2 [Alosa sapidissima]
MTLEEVHGQDNSETTDRMQVIGTALEELLVSAKKQDCLTVEVYESAKVMNVDPDNVAYCVLATDEEYECDIALQIHFTLIQAFCFANHINIVRFEFENHERCLQLANQHAASPTGVFSKSFLWIHRCVTS